MKLKYTPALICLALVSCMTTPNEQKSTISQHDSVTGVAVANAAKVLDNKPADLDIEIKDRGGTILHVKQPVAGKSDVSANNSGEEKSDQTGSASWTQTIPLGVKLAFAGFGLVMIAIGAYLIYAILSRSKTINAIVSETDSRFSAIVKNLQSKAATEDDKGKMALLNQVAQDVTEQKAEFYKAP